MNFFRQATPGAVLVLITLFMQSGGMAMLIHLARVYFATYTSRHSLFISAELVVRFTTVIIGLHLLEMSVWAIFYRCVCFQSWDSAFYFSATSYSTVGYGDVVLPQSWRNLGPLESITGVLMCGLSASFLFAIVTRLVDRETGPSQKFVEPVCDPLPRAAD